MALQRTPLFAVLAAKKPEPREVPAVPFVLSVGREKDRRQNGCQKGEMRGKEIIVGGITYPVIPILQKSSK